jgi:hypothetical protein
MSRLEYGIELDPLVAEVEDAVELAATRVRALQALRIPQLSGLRAKLASQVALRLIHMSVRITPSKVLQRR